MRVTVVQRMLPQYRVSFFRALMARIEATGGRLSIVAGQPGRSEGMALKELADLLVEEGAKLAINLDGGGSTTLVTRDDAGGSRVLNVPVGIFDQPGTERPVAFSLGVRAAPPPAATQPASSRTAQ